MLGVSVAKLRSDRRPDIPCAFCGQPFHPKKPTARFCSKPCGLMGNRRGVALWGKKEGTAYERQAEKIKASRIESYHNDPEYKHKFLARKAALQAYPDPKPCERCGNAKADRHHDDYDKPTEIRWFCRKCHFLHHIETFGTWGGRIYGKDHSKEANGQS
jgi:ribosomal protein S27AE